MVTVDRLTMTQAAERLGISRVTLRRLVHEGKLPVLENPLDKREKLIPVEAVERLAGGAGVNRPRPRTAGGLSDPELHSDEVEEWLEAHWHPC